MALIPNQSAVAIGQNVEIVAPADQPTLTYKIDFEAGRVVGMADKTAAMKQAIVKILSSERFSYLIYSWAYGVEMRAVVGKSFQVLASEIKRVIREALLADGRITDVTDFAVQQIDRRTVRVSFMANTIFGRIPIEKEVGTGV